MRIGTGQRAAAVVPAALLAVGLLATGCTGGGEGAADAAPSPRVIQPGAPGEPNTVIASVEEAAPDDDAGEPHEADLAFMLGMYPHHAQALQMTALVEERAASPDLPVFAARMDASQLGELDQIERWLTAAGIELPEGHDHADMGDMGMSAMDMVGMGGRLMPGMLTEEELDELAAAEGEAFDRLFLEGMTRHHEGALQMVEDLLATEGAAQDPRVHDLALHIAADQEIEIGRMAEMLAELDG